MPKGQTETSTTTIDPQAEAYRNQIYQQSLNLPEWSPYGGQMVAGPSQQTMQGFQMAGRQDPRMQQGYGGMAANLGLANQFYANQLGQGGTFTGADMAAYQNPYQQAVTDAMQSDYARLRGQGLNEVGAQASGAGAFGGARHGLAEAARMGELARAEAGQLAGVRQQGFESAAQKWAADRQYQQQTAGQMANLGMSGMQGLNAMQQQQAQAMMGQGEYGRGIEQQRLQAQYNQYLQGQQAPYTRLAAQQGNFGAPTGQTTETFTPFDPWGTMIGIGTTASGFMPGG